MKFKKLKKQNKIRLIFFSTGESEIRQFEFNLRRLIIKLIALSVIIIGVFWGSVTLLNSMYQSNTNSTLLRTNTFLKGKIKKLQSNIEKLNEKLISLEEDTEDLGVLVGLSSTEADSQIIKDGIILGNNIVMASMPVDYEYQTDKMSEYMNILEERISSALKLQDIIEDKFLQTQKEIKHIPSIRPVTGGRITDRFGKRRDPFVERVKHHNGIDISAHYGTKIHAAATGLVEMARMRYRLNKGYGRVVIINHGYGYKTLYGHLSKILVKPGQKVKRWDVIGLSGNSGRATGPHLHYEVWHNGQPQNPENYILN
ncbi:MAG: peptidoglycan DD-metalloendopeptidase family protein [bacterium]